MKDRSTGPGQPRRRFVNWLLGTSVGGIVLSVLYPITRYLIPPRAAEAAASSVTLAFAPADIAPGTAKIFKFGNRPALLVRTVAGELRAMSATCTHLGCIVQYREDLGHIWCACHNGHFDLNGRNIAGPPPAPLETYVVRESGDQIVVTRGA
jgi:Rieske Fe-S protein